MISSLDRLQKEIDALTYNARSVLQALQDSAVSAGSSKGFTVNRLDKKITLSRVDIYRLYRFYQDWENNGFALEDSPATSASKAIKGFDTIRLEHDKTPVKDDYANITDKSATSTALAKHGRMLYLNSDNVGSYDSDPVWYGMIASAANPKMVTSSAPVPINLRTPIFDENLSTTHYNSHPTYLFPMGYYRLDLLGYSNDGVNHYAAGNGWDISGDDYVRIESKHIAFGSIDYAAIRRTKENRVGDYSIAWGFDTQANSRYSTVGGFHSIASQICSVAIGRYGYASGDSSAVVGGHYNTATRSGSGVFGGYGNYASGSYSGILGGRRNNTGGRSYNFTVKATSGSSDCFSDCSDICAEDVNENVTTIPGYDVLIVAASIATLNDWKINDTVVIHSFKTKTSTGLSNQWIDQVGGTGFASTERVISSISSDPDNSAQCIIRLSASVPYTYIDGGKIFRLRKAGNPIDFGYCSATVGGQGLVAQGMNQVVVGTFNKYLNVADSRIDRDTAKFVIGSGRSENTRGNVLEVYNDGLVVYTNNSSSEVNTRDFSGFYVSPDLIRSRLGDSTFNLTKNYNSFGLIDTESLVRSAISFGSNTSNPYTRLESARVAIVANNRMETAVDALNPGIYLDAPIIDLNADSILASATVGDFNISTVANLNLVFGKLTLEGDTYGALFTPSTGRSFQHSYYDGPPVYSCISEVNVPALDMISQYPDGPQLGFGSGTNILGAGGPAHLLTYASEEKTDGTINIMQMIWGEAISGNVDKTLTSPTDPGYIHIRKGIVTPQTGLSGKLVGGDGKYTEWDAIATHSYVAPKFEEVGTSSHVTLRPDVYVVESVFGGVSHKIENSLDVYSVTEFSLTRSGNLAHLHIEVDFSVNFYSSSFNAMYLFMNMTETDYKKYMPKHSVRASVFDLNNPPFGVIGTGLIFNPIPNQFSSSSGDIQYYSVLDKTLVIKITPTSSISGSSSFKFGFTVTYRNNK